MKRMTPTLRGISKRRLTGWRLAMHLTVTPKETPIPTSSPHAGVSQTIFIEDGQLGLGRWQGIFFCEFDGPRRRQLRVKIVPDRSE